ncbi:MAG: hypothetical protein HQM15_03655 [Deltaproteobacteria bacterium]|nr:hypothetical protein [Deltaproteobacteria bacterium]
MALKLNIQPKIESEINQILKLYPYRSKTEYINEAIAEYNKQLIRKKELEKLKEYYKKTKKEHEEILNEFHQIRKPID